MGENETVGLTVALYPEDGEEVAMRTIGLGLQPLILIEAEENEDGRLDFTVTASLLDSIGSVRDLVQFADALLGEAQRQAQEAARD